MNPANSTTMLRRTTIALLLLSGVLAGCNEWKQQVQTLRNQTSHAIQLQDHVLTDADVSEIVSAYDFVEVLQADRSEVTLDGCRQLKRLPSLRRLTLRGSRLSDECASALANISSLETLNLPDADFTSKGLIELTKLPRLELLRVASPRVDDTVMAHIAKMESLRFLHLIDIPITDEGIRQLEGMDHLESLYLDGSGVTQEGLERLIRSQPGLHLHVDQNHLDIDPQRGHDDTQDADGA